MLARLLIPHVLAIAAFGAAYAWMRHVGNNRSMVDLYLGASGYFLGFAAFATSAAAVILVLIHRDQRARWPWLLAHLGLLVVVFAQGFTWLAMHLA